MKNSIRRIATLLLAVVMLLSMGAPAFADGEQPHEHVYVDGVCSDPVCGAEEPKVHEHDYSELITTEASCVAEGVKTFTCLNDGCDRPEYTEAIPATGVHNYAQGVCSVCGAEEPKTPTCSGLIDCPVSEGHNDGCEKAAAEAEAAKQAAVSAVQAMIDALNPSSAPEDIVAVEAKIGEILAAYPEYEGNPENAFNMAKYYNFMTLEETPVAMMGDAKFATLEAAMTEANKAAGNYTITLLADNAEIFTFAQNSGVNITIDGDKKTFTGKITLSGGGNLTITNATLTPSNADAKTIVLSALTAPDITITKCTLKNVGTKGAIVWGQASTTGNKVLVSDCNAANLQYIVGTNQSGCLDITVDGVSATGMAYLVRPMKATRVTVKNVTYSGLTFIEVKNSNECTLHLENVNVSTTQLPPLLMSAPDSGTGVTYTIILKGQNSANGAKMSLNNHGDWIALESEALPYQVVNYLDGAGKEADPYKISSLDELIAFRDNVNCGSTLHNADGVYVALTADIDMSQVDWSVNIGDDCNYTFDGIFDGQNHRISNLSFTETKVEPHGYLSTGLFGAIYGNAVIKNLTLENVSINTGSYTGNNIAAVVGITYTATGAIDNVNVIGDIKIDAGINDGVGVIAGYALNSSLTIKNCTVSPNDGSYVNGRAYVGGIIGYGGNATLSDNKVENLTVNASSCVAGGIAGIMLNGSEASGNTVKDTALVSTHAYWKNAAAVVTGTFEGSVKVSNTTESGNTANGSASSVLVGSLSAYQPTSPLGKAQAVNSDWYYGTLEKAIEAATDGDTITLLDNVSDSITVNKALTVVKNGCTAALTVGETFMLFENETVYKIVRADSSDIKFTVLDKNNNTQFFDSFAEAYAAAKDGDTITLYDDLSISESIELEKSITIDGNGHTLSYTGSGYALSLESDSAGSALTLKNITIDAPDAQRGINFNKAGGSLTLDKVTLSASLYAVNLRGGADNVTVSINDSTLSGKLALNLWGSGCTVDVTNSTLYSNHSTPEDCYSVIQLNNDGTNIADGTTVTVTGGKLISTAEIESSRVATSNWTNTGKIIISDDTTVTGSEQIIVATIGAEGYRSLQAALSVVPENGSIRLLRDATVDSDIALSKSLTVNTDGKTLTIAEGASLSFANDSVELIILGMDDKIAQVRAAFPELCVRQGSIIIKKSHSLPTGSCKEQLECADCRETVSNPDVGSHALAYTASGSVITETCTKGCGHSVKAELKLQKGASLKYTGDAVTPLELDYGNGWLGGDLSIAYLNNTYPGPATGTATIDNASATLSFTIEPVDVKMWEARDYHRDTGESLTFTIKTGGKQPIELLSPVSLYTSGGKHVCDISSYTLLKNSDGNLLLTIPASVMSKLSVGRYELVCYLADSRDPDNGVAGVAADTFRVRYPLVTPPTGDSANFLLWGGLLLGATAALGGSLLMLKKYGRKK